MANLPKPAMLTVSPLSSASAMAETTALTAVAASPRDNDERATMRGNVSRGGRGASGPARVERDSPGPGRRGLTRCGCGAGHREGRLRQHDKRTRASSRFTRLLREAFWSTPQGSRYLCDSPVAVASFPPSIVAALRPAQETRAGERDEDAENGGRVERGEGEKSRGLELAHTLGHLTHRQNG